jgi:AbrB family looped-hinge helix DNA binding protein
MKINMTSSFEKHFYGAVSVGARGQVVIPKAARKEFNIKAGDRLIVMGKPGGGLKQGKKA